MHDDISPCASGDHCRAYDPATKQPALATTRDPLCDACLTTAARDIRALVYDYLDLAQMQAPTLSQALDTQPGARREPPMPLKAAPEALQAEIHHVTTTWEELVRDTLNLAPLPPTAPAGRAVQRAATTLHTHHQALARIPATTVYPTGCEDQPTDITGWEAVHHLQDLHRRARSMLGRTRRTRRLPGTCPTCTSNLHQDEPRHQDDPCPVYCANPNCGQQWDHDEYETWATNLLLTTPRRKATVA